ncbi:MAG: YhbY family RNA-binding protein [Candidatus Thorarchaeota archaeon]
MPSKKDDLVQVRKDPAILQIGKNGFSIDVFTELEMQLKRHKVVKIRVGKSAPFSSKEEALTALRDSLPQHIRIVEARGWTVILERIL